MPEAVMELAGSSRSLPAQVRPLGPVAPEEVLHASLYLRRRDDPAVLEGAASLAERRARLAGHRREGHAADLRRIAAFAAAAGLHVDAAYPERRLVRLSGPAWRMEAAFGTRLTRYQAEGGRFRARAGALSVPADIAGIVESVLGLDDRPLARRGRGPMRPAQAGQGLLPNAVAALYGYPASARATGQTIGLIELGGGFDPADTAAAFAAMGIPAPTVAAVSVDGATNSPSGGGADGEVALDIQIAGGAAPGAKLAVYFAPNSDAGFADALAAAIHDSTHAPSVVSISWGAPESVWTGQAVATMNAQLEDAASLGLSVFAAAGDSLATDGVNDGAAHVTFPASSHRAVGCGGTEITVAGGVITAETVWNDGSNGTGGGISDLFPVPAFQAGAGLPPSVNGGRAGRGVPDVAADASPASGYLVTVGGQAMLTGGTSAVAPLWAGLVALVNAKAGHTAGFFLPALYATPGLTRQITTGDNRPAGSALGYDAGGHWNGCTGLGVPVGAAFFAAFG